MRRLGWLLAVLLGVGCSRKEAPVPAPVDAGPAEVVEHEPNDRPEQAQPLNGSTVVTGSLTADPAHPDEDWYVLSSGAPKVADVTVGGIPGTGVTLEAYDGDRNRLALAKGTPGAPVRFPDLGVRGQVWVRVLATSRGSGGAYTLTALFSEPKPGFEWEPNDRAADATELHEGEVVPAGWQVSGFVGHAEDQDWYRVQLRADGGVEVSAAPGVDAGAVDAGSAGGSAPLPQAAADAGADAGLAPAVDGGTDGGVAPAPPEPREALRLELTGVPGVRPEVQILSEAQAPLFTATGKEGEPLSLRNVGVRSADRVIYVLVKSAWTGTGKEAKKGFNADKPYTLTLTREAAGANAELEPNDDPEHATPLAADGYREGFIATKADVDEYVVQPGAPSILQVQLSGVEHLDLQLSLVQPKPGGGEVVLKKANEGAVKEPEYLSDIACATACYFRVEGALKKENGKWVRPYANPDQPYRLSVTRAPDDGSLEREPNDTAETATPLTLGKPIRGTVQPVRDDDFYKLDLSNRPVKTSLKATATGILKVDIGLYLWRQTDSGKELVQTAEHGRGDAPRVIHYAAEPGVYFLEVRDAKNRESNFQDFYQLTVEESE